MTAPAAAKSRMKPTVTEPPYEERLADVRDEGWVVFVANAEVEAHVGGKHCEAAGVECGSESRAECEAERGDDAEAAELPCRAAGEGFDEEVDAVYVALATHDEGADDCDRERDGRCGYGQDDGAGES